jgi:hypothetical protein
MMYMALSKRHPGKYCVYQDCLLQQIIKDNLEFTQLKDFTMKNTVKQIKVKTKNGNRPTLFMPSLHKMEELPAAETWIRFADFETFLKLKEKTNEEFD